MTSRITRCLSQHFSKGHFRRQLCELEETYTGLLYWVGELRQKGAFRSFHWRHILIRPWQFHNALCYDRYPVPRKSENPLPVHTYEKPTSESNRIYLRYTSETSQSPDTCSIDTVTKELTEECDNILKEVLTRIVSSISKLLAEVQRSRGATTHY